ncbi:hypothetical protein Javan253_0033 [Streptococcus phage Javan253]|nr:DUF1492 domain-containing protein [Streptococcus henryi]QBX16489.1 hypothetical protein Javan253_0033 [Streptococcus phage Javan253]
MSKEKNSAEELLEELRVIPKFIEQLKLDIEATRSSMLTSPQWSDMRVQGGLKKSQEDKNIAIIDVSDYNVAEIEKLIERKKYIIELIMQIPDMAQRHILITTYARCESFDEAMDVLQLTGNRNKYYTIKRKAVQSLENILKHTDLY